MKKPRITRTVIREIVVQVDDDRLHGMIHWHGGDHTALDVATRVRGRWRETRRNQYRSGNRRADHHLGPG